MERGGGREGKTGLAAEEELEGEDGGEDGGDEGHGGVVMRFQWRLQGTLDTTLNPMVKYY